MWINFNRKFEASHRLYNTDDQCKAIHGHSWTVQFSYEISTYHISKKDKKGMAFDFSVLKKEFTNFIKDELDHALFLNENDSILQEIKERDDLKLRLFKQDPTTEILAAVMLRKLMMISAKLNSKGSSSIILNNKLHLNETKVNSVTLHSSKDIFQIHELPDWLMDNPNYDASETTTKA